MARVKLDLHEVHNPNCEQCKNRDERNTRDGLCETVLSVDDSLPVRCVGKWARDKIFFLNQYFGIFGNGMKKRWDGRLDYFEICSGPGRCVVREEACEIDGTSLAVTHNQAFAHYNGATFFDIGEKVVDVLNQRFEDRGIRGRAEAIVADYYDAKGIAFAAQERSAGGLNLAFIDPTDCSVPFSTVQALVDTLHSVDLIINVAVGTDATRNIKPAILDANSKSRIKYKNFLGGNDFFCDDEVVFLAKAGKNDQLRLKFREYYRRSLKGLGFKYFATERVEHFYDLLFASRHPKGLEFWKKAQKYSPYNQGAFPF